MSHRRMIMEFVQDKNFYCVGWCPALPLLFPLWQKSQPSTTRLNPSGATETWMQFNSPLQDSDEVPWARDLASPVAAQRARRDRQINEVTVRGSVLLTSAWCLCPCAASLPLLSKSSSTTMQKGRPDVDGWIYETENTLERYLHLALHMVSLDVIRCLSKGDRRVQFGQECLRCYLTFWTMNVPGAQLQGWITHTFSSNCKLLRTKSVGNSIPSSSCS
ncbi:uncharacterized protein LOC112664515 [Canis lupus dingo]|uniref:uncharacterized protein LOC112664515 n=1 Tax=Canis lupus dingo TaxID=286419 RepID=UPI0020C49379|nr:uncharacterized protein LOC112664515 [Canis lupus dingo]